jgi:hypothetical protein
MPGGSSSREPTHTPGERSRLEVHRAHPSAARRIAMRALYLITGLCVATLLGACTTVYERPVATYTPAPSVAYVTPSYVAPAAVVVH